MGRSKRLSWDDTEAFLDKAKVWTEQKETKYDLVVGIMRGGLPLAVPLSHMLDIPMGVLGVSGFNPESPEDNYRICEGKLLPLKPAKKHRVLLVDDIIDHGNTLKAAIAFVNPAQVDICCMATKITKKELPKMFNCDVFTGYKVPKTMWVTFPWEEI